MNISRKTAITDISETIPSIERSTPTSMNSVYKHFLRIRKIAKGWGSSEGKQKINSYRLKTRRLLGGKFGLEGVFVPQPTILPAGRI